MQPCAECRARREIAVEGVAAGAPSLGRAQARLGVFNREMLLREPLWRIERAAGMWAVHLSPMATHQVTAEDPSAARLIVRDQLTNEARTGRCWGCRANERAKADDLGE